MRKWASEPRRGKWMAWTQTTQLQGRFWERQKIQRLKRPLQSLGQGGSVSLEWTGIWLGISMSRWDLLASRCWEWVGSGPRIQSSPCQMLRVVWMLFLTQTRLLICKRTIFWEESILRVVAESEIFPWLSQRPCTKLGSSMRSLRSKERLAWQQSLQLFQMDVR